MKVYIDVVIFLNFLFDFILLLSVNYILRRNVKVYRLLLGSFLGSITLIILFLPLSNLAFLLFKFLTSVIILIATFGFKDSSYFFKNLLYFYLVSMLLGGGIYFLNNQFSYSKNGLVFTPRGLGLSYIVILIISLFIFYKYLHSLKQLKNNYSNYYKCKIYFTESLSLEVNAFLDTGNKLIDPYTKKSIILIDKNIYNFDTMPPLYVPYHTLNHEGLLKCYKADHLEIEGRCYKKFLVGVSHENFFIDGINCIINNEIMEGLK